ncbi:MAG: hypothetical protein COB16_17155 [Rhodobacteraceae bacterium]|nr:MAG: hypothetical protein COB16_17155 [Paracoccaceae bacterium]
MKRFAALFAALLLAVPALADTPLTRHFSGLDSCYGRQYTKSHLAKHQQQQVVEIRLSHFPGDQQFLGLGGNYHSYPETPVLSLILSVRLRGQNLGKAQLYCTQDGDRLHCGLECDAGHFYVTDRTPDSILIKGGGDLYFSDCGEEEHVLRRKPDDKVFLLHRLPASACHP